MLELMTGKKLKSLSGHYGAVNCVVGHHVEQVRGKDGERVEGDTLVDTSFSLISYLISEFFHLKLGGSRCLVLSMLPPL